MADEYQSSSQLVGNLNSQETILARGEISFDVDDSVGGVYLGQSSVDITSLRASVANPTFEFYRYTDNGAPTYSRSLTKGGGTTFSFGSGNVTYQDNGFLFWSDGTGGTKTLKLMISVRASSSVTVRYFYIVKSTSITNSDVFIT